MTNRQRWTALVGIAFTAGCATAKLAVGRSAPQTTATAILRDLSGHQVGTVTLTDSYAGVILDGSVAGIGLGGHGIHVHELGKCEPPFVSAGAHFNPDHKQHGFKNANGHHAGDLPNLEAPAAGQLKFEFLLPGVTLTALLNADGAAVVIHGATDDHVTDPAGNSGGRIVCGVITRR